MFNAWISDDAPLNQPGQFRLSINYDTDETRYEIAAWSAGLTWTIFECFEPIVPGISAALGQERKFLAEVVRPATEKWMAADVEKHQARHRVALSHGLSAGGRNDLPHEKILIDRHLKRMLENDGVDLINAARLILSNDCYVSFACNNLNSAHYFGDRPFGLLQRGAVLPTFFTWLPLGEADYCGFGLDIPFEIPETILGGAAGRRLGAVIDTGLSELDERIVARVISRADDEEDDVWNGFSTRIVLEPDLVQLG